jgi:hypothetical protein
MIKAILNFIKGKENLVPLKDEAMPELSILDERLSRLNKHFILLDKPLKNLLTFLKEKYDYDSASYYYYSQPFSQYNEDDQLFLKEALDQAYAKSRTPELHSFAFIELKRFFDNNHSSNIVPIYSFLQNDDIIRILLDGIDINLNFLRIKTINLKNINLKNIHGRKFIEYREYYDDDTNTMPSFQHLQSVFSAAIPLRNSPPILDINDAPVTEEEFLNYKDRDVELIIRRYFDKNSIEHCSIELLNKKDIIKSKLIKMTNEKIDIDKEVDDFLFPLLETSESLALSNLTPVFSKDFMSNDFSDYILLKKMEDI